MEAKYSPIFWALPKYATRPAERIIALSKPAKTEAGGWWIVQTTAMFCATAISVRKPIIMTAEAESTPEVGSSRKRTDGFFDSATAIDSRRLLPPESPRMNSLPALVCCESVRPTSLIILSMAAARSSAERPAW